MNFVSDMFFFPQGYQEKNKFIAAQGNARLFAAAKLFNWI